MATQKRKHYFIKKKFQLRYFLINLLFMLIGSLIVGYTVYSTGWALFGEQLSKICPQGYLSAQIRFVNNTLFFRMLLLMPIIAVISLFLSHRIAGPLYRLEHSLKEIAQNLNLTLRFKLRKKDELKELAEALNKVMDKFAELVSHNKTAFKETTHLVDELDIAIQDESLDINEIRQILGKLKEQIEESEGYLARYQVYNPDK